MALLPYPESLETFQKGRYGKSSILSTRGFETAEKRLVIIQGSGGVRPGIWSRSLCLEEGSDVGLNVNSSPNRERARFSCFNIEPL